MRRYFLERLNSLKLAILGLMFHGISPSVANPD